MVAAGGTHLAREGLTWRGRDSPGGPGCRGGAPHKPPMVSPNSRWELPCHKMEKYHKGCPYFESKFPSSRDVKVDDWVSPILIQN